MKKSTRTRLAFFALGIVILTVLSVLSGACASKPEATPTPTRTPRPTESPPTATLVPTQQPSPTDEPSQTPMPEPTATPAATSTPTLDPNVIVPARDPKVSPLTGLRPADPSVLDRRPLAVKIPNEQAAIPQSGLNKADVVVESRVEYCMTRFTAIFQSQDLGRLGNIRSARLIDAELPVIFDAVLAFSGSVEPVRQKLYQSDIGDHILEQALNGPAFFRDPNIPVPHNLFADTATLWSTLTQKGWNKRPAPAAGWVFSEAVPAGGSPAHRVDVSYPEYKVAWTYDAGSGRWQRSMNGEIHMDKADGKPVTAADVIVLGANHVPTLIPEHGEELTDGPCSNRSIEIQLWGEGPLTILRDGQAYEGKWLRPDRHAPVRFVDASGKDIPLKPGNSWWQVVPLDLSVKVS